MKRLLAFSILIVAACLLCAFQQQILTPIFQAPSSAAAITLDASCTASGTVSPLACSSAMTVTAGDTITCNVAGVSGGNNETGAAFDPTNGFYDNVYGIAHPSNSLSWVTTAVKQNSAGGSITPYALFSSTPLSRITISCYAWNGTASSYVLDGGAVEQTQSTTATNRSSGTAAAPTNSNEVVIAYMSQNSSTAPTAGSGWTPSGTLTLVGGSGMRQTSEYQIQTSPVSVNGSMTSTANVAYLDSQLALLQNGTTGGYRSLSGAFVPMGAPGSAPTGTMSAALLGAAGSTLTSVNLNASPYWTLNGTAPTYDTSVNPTGTGKIMVQGVAHTFGDAGSSMLAAGGSGTSNFSLTFADQIGGLGTPHWMSLFFRLASGGATNQPCDDWYLNGATTEPQMIVQTDFTTGTSYTLHLEGSANDASQNTSTLTTDTDYWFQLHLAGVNERYHQMLVYTKSGSVWSLASTLNEDVLCSNAANTNCSTPAANATTTGTASSGSTTLTVASGTGIVVGQVVLGAGIPDPSQGGAAWTVVAAVAGTSVTLSQNTSAPLSGTTVNFYTAPAHFVAGTNCSVTTGSTAMTCVTPGTGTIAVGNAIGSSGTFTNTLVTAVSLPNVTLSVPATTTLTNAGVNFWSPPAGSSGFAFGKNAGGSCGITSNQWFSVPVYDPYGTWGAFAPN